MKYVKMLGLLVVAAAALMAFVGPASAATLTNPSGTVLGAGTVIKANSTHSFLDGSIDVTCTTSHVEGSITNAGGVVEGKTQTVKGNVTALSFSGCNKDTVTVVKGGTLELHSLGGNTGTLTSSGAEVTVQVHRTLLGFPITSHCTYVTNNNDIGEITGTVAGSTPKFDIDSDEIKLDPETSSDACGTEATWTGSYTVTSPDNLFID